MAQPISRRPVSCPRSASVQDEPAEPIHPNEAPAQEPLFAAPVAFGVVLGASLGVMLAVLMGANANFMLRDMHVSGALAGWCIGAAVGGLSGGFLSAFIGWEMTPDAATPSAIELAPQRRPR
ncbi:MAG TPA: hypothetical protein VE029_05965 [Rhizobacter sp.]|nr:hypothetical protein [Rhizobacter sp.]